ncbi:MAG: hypothetical protein GXO03_05160 [Aquificae bacterium]|nr:hypothetical protein [Aquificota bacterium]
MSPKLGKLFPALVFIEVVLLAVLLWVTGVVFFKQDPLLVNEKYSPTLLLSLVISLYYGFTGGLLFIAVLSALAYFYYEPFPYQEILWNLLVVLIASEFRFYWEKRIRLAEMEREYLTKQVDKLRKELFLMKLSHDQLELNYIVKPYSLRRLLEQVKERLLKEKDERAVMSFFLSLLLQNFQVYRASVYRVKEHDRELLAFLGDRDILDPEDPLVKLVLEEESSFYLPPKALKKFSEHGELKYLAALMVPEDEKSRLLLLIKDMLFVNLNEEALNYMLIIFSYLAEDMAVGKALGQIYEEKPPCPFDFVKELYKMYKLKEELGIESSIAVFRAKELPPDYPYAIERAIRGLDVFCVLERERLVIFLLPFTPEWGAQRFTDRMVKLFPWLEPIAVFKVKEPDVRAYVRRVLK